MHSLVRLKNVTQPRPIEKIHLKIAIEVIKYHTSHRMRPHIETLSPALRKQSREVLHERRKQVVRLHLKGVGVMQIVQQTGLSWSGVNAALRLFKQSGAAALKPHVRARSLAWGAA